MKYAIYIYFLWAAGKMAYFYYYKKFERKYRYRKWYVFSHWFSCFMLLYGAVLCRLERRVRAYKILLDGSWDIYLCMGSVFLL